MHNNPASRTLLQAGWPMPGAGPGPGAQNKIVTWLSRARDQPAIISHTYTWVTTFWLEKGSGIRINPGREATLALLSFVAAYRYHGQAHYVC